MKAGIENLRFQKIVVTIAILLFIIKGFAYLITNSVAVLTDALESIANVAAGLIGLYSISVAARPKDIDHPYGHGKVEFLSAAIEGTLISIAGVLVIYESVQHLLSPQPLQQLDSGIILITVSAVINYITGYASIRKGRQNHSPALVATGKHLQTDAYTTAGIIVGLVLIYLTGLTWIDSVIAILFAGIILFTGYRIIRKSIAVIMDEADTELLIKLIDFLNIHKRSAWVDLHNLRVIKYGGQLHVDSHLTLPWYYNLNEAHAEIEALATMIREEFGFSVEFFVHTDPCLYTQCNICEKEECPVRQHPFEKRIPWVMDNVLSDKKHILKITSKGR